MIRLYLSLLCIAASLTTVTAQPDLPETRREVLAMAGAGVPDTSAYLQALAELAEAAIYVDNLSFARNASMLTAETAKLYGQISPEESARANLVNAKVTYQISRRHPEGIGMAQAALADAREAEHPLLAAEALYHRARFERGVQQPEARIRTLDTLLRLTQGEPELAKWHCYALLEQARDLKETKELDEALVVANRALMNFDRNHPEGSWWALDILGDITSRMGDEGAALDYYNRTVAQYFPDHRTDTAGVLRPVTDELATFFDATTILNHRARFFRRTGRPDLALVDYNTVISFRERQRDANVVESSRMRQSRILMEFYSESISAHYELREADPDHIWEALALSDRVKAYALVSHLANRSVSPDDEKAVELRRHIATLERDQPPGIPLSGELALLELELAEHLEDIRGGNKPIISFDIAQLKKLVADLEGGLLQYSTGYEKAFVFYVDAAGRLSMHEIEDVYNTMYGVFGFRATIEETAYNAKSFRPKSIQDSMDLAFLSQGLDMMRKVLPGIEPDSLPRRLLVIPDQAINFLPFAALPVDSTADPHDYADLRYLIDDHDISYGYSLRHQVQLTGLPDRDKRYDLLAFAPKFRGTANPSDVIAARGAGYPLGSDSVIALNGLAHNVSEAELIATKLPNCRVVAGVEATREAFLAARSESRILHLSSHGAMSAKHPRHSFVAFSQEDEVLEEDQLLYFNDLPSYGIDADLVVLSACETSIGLVAPGESALTMAAAFIDAGAHSVVSNLWSIDDNAAKQLMEYFYAGLGAGKSRTLAANSAQRKMRTTGGYTHPFYWAAMTLYGQPGTIPPAKRGLPWWIIGLGLGAIAIAGGAWFFNRA